MSALPDSGSRLDDIFYILSDSTRRQILSELADDSSHTDTDVATTEISGDDERFEGELITLYHNHLPRLEESGFIDWNRETDTITLGPRFEEIRPTVRILREHQSELPDDWP